MPDERLTQALRKISWAISNIKAAYVQAELAEAKALIQSVLNDELPDEARQAARELGISDDTARRIRKEIR
jgi:hypothetical protein